MSRGPGRWQRLVLEMVAAATGEDEMPLWVTVEDVENPDCATCHSVNTYDRSRREAIRRAIRRLHDQGLVEGAYVLRDRDGRVERRVLAARRPLSPSQLARELEAEALRLRQRAEMWRDLARMTRSSVAWRQAVDAERDALTAEGVS